MKVKRIVANIHARDAAAAKCFYQDVLGLDLLMDHGWIRTYGLHEEMSIQISFASPAAQIRLRPTYRLKSTISMPHWKA